MRLTEAYASFQLYYLVNNGRTEKTQKEYYGRLLGRNGLITVVGDLPVEYLGIDHIVEWKLHMRAEGLQAVYINHCLSGVRHFLRWLEENGETKVFDWRKIGFEPKELNKPHTTLDPKEIDKLIASAPNLRDKAIIGLFFGTGCRSAEIIGLDRDAWEAAQLVDKDNRVWEIWVLGKNSKYRPVYFSSSVKFRVDEYLATRTDRFKPLFISLQNRRIHFNTVGKMLHEATRKAGLDKRVTQHVLRHSYATEMANNGAPIPVLAYNLGHKDGTVTQKIYTHINAAQSRRNYAIYHPEFQKPS